VLVEGGRRRGDWDVRNDDDINVGIHFLWIDINFLYLTLQGPIAVKSGIAVHKLLSRRESHRGSGE